MNYKALHLQWIVNHPRFVPPQIYKYPYIEIMEQTYRNKAVTDDVALVFFRADVKWYHDSIDIISNIVLQSKAPPLPDSLFITIGFNHQTWTPNLCHNAIENLLKLTFIKEATAVFELHRENGEHPHVHFLIVTDKKYPKSRIIDRIYASKGIKDLIVGKQFIDYKVAEAYHVGYVSGIKKPEKMQYVELDNNWKIMKGLPYNYSK
jgi:hypothetical protein